jgi:porin
MRQNTFGEVTMNRNKHLTLIEHFPQFVLFLLGLLCLAQPTIAAGPDYSGDFLKRSTLTGDWGGARNDLAKKGVTFNTNLVLTEQGVLDGGKDREWEIGGRGSLLFNVDTGKLGLWPGGFLTAELEWNFGKGVNRRSGGLMPVNTNQIFPVPAEEGVALPALNFTQFLSEYGGVVVGKIDTSGGDMNEFAHGKGDTQFMNLAFNLNPALLMTVPYSTLGTGLIILPTKDPNAAIVTFSVVSAEGKATTSGLDNLNKDKLSYNVEARVRTDFFGLSGHQLVGAIYSNKEFTSIDQRLTLEPGSNSIAKKTGSQSVYYNFDQYLYEPVKGSGKGFGLFGRFAATDGNPNFLHYFISLGIGGKGVMASRPNDRFGLGWYWIGIKNPTFTGPLSTREILRDEQGVEAYYSVALTPWVHLTPNIQVIHGTQEKTVTLPPAIPTDIDTATVVGLRLQVLF